MDTKKYLQKFMLDNKQSYYFIIAFILMSVVLTILIFSALGMNGQYEREATKIKEQANGLRELLRTQMLQKQSLQKQHSEVLDTIKRVEATFEDQLILIERKRGELAQLQTTIGHQANILPPPTDTPVKKREDALGPGVFMNPQPDLKDVTANRVVDVPAPRTPPSPDEIISTEDKRKAVKEGFLHAWNSYKTYAWGTDELNPLKKTFKNWLDLGVTIVDSLDTLWIMGLHDEFQLARDWIASNLSFEKNRNVSFFETTIRELGGLLSAYEFSRDRVFLDKAEDLGKRLLKAFTDSSPIPFASVNLQNGHGSAPGWTGGASILSEMGTIQLEFLYLAYHTGNPTYAIKPMNVFKHLDSLPKSVEGLYPLYINQATGTFKGNDYSIGALGDSFYEYMVKLWLFTDKQGNGYKRMFQESARGMMSTLVQTSPSGYRYMAQTSRGNIQNKMEHLTCFSGGMFALGAMEDIDPHKADHFQLAADLTETCHESYDRSPTKIGPETFEFRGKDEFIIPSGSSYYILRPEVIESYFVLWRTTHDPKYRRWAWEAFLAIETHCKMEAGYSGIRNVGQIPVVHDDTQQSFFLAETLKYLYLIFSDDDVVPLSDYVFNTEAHPLGKIKLPLREWDQRIRDLILTE